MSEESYVEEQEEQEVDINDIKDNIRLAFDESVTEELDEDSTKMAMIGAGATFKNVTRMYNEFMIDAGFAISKADRNQIVDDTLEGHDLEEESDFDNAVAALIESIQGANLRSASALVRAYAKRNEVPIFSKPKTEGGTRNPFVMLFHEKLVEDPKMTEQDLKDLISGLSPDHQTNPTRWFAQHNNIRKTANSIAAKYED